MKNKEGELSVKILRYNSIGVFICFMCDWQLNNNFYDFYVSDPVN